MNDTQVIQILQELWPESIPPGDYSKAARLAARLLSTVAPSAAPTVAPRPVGRPPKKAPPLPTARASTVREGVLKLLQQGPHSAADLAKALNAAPGTVYGILGDLKTTRTEEGKYALEG